MASMPNHFARAGITNASPAAALLTMGRRMAHQEINKGRTSLLREK
jgi:hypothetical protein